LISDCSGRLKTLVQNEGARYSVSFELSLRLVQRRNPMRAIFAGGCRIVFPRLGTMPINPGHQNTKVRQAKLSTPAASCAAKS
jgi:hypothetical protein